MVSVRDGGRTTPTVSVIVPTHNYAQFLPAAIESVRSQTFADWECIVVDDGSTDNTPTVLHELAANEPRLVVVSQPQRGASAARNTGLHLARGEFVQFLDADDLLQPAKFEMHVAALRARPEADIVYGPTAYFDDDAITAWRTWHRGPRPETTNVPADVTSTLSWLLVENPITIAAPLARTSALRRAGGFDEAVDLMEDWDLWLRCAIDGQRFVLVASDQPVALIRVHSESASHSQAPMLVREIAVRRKIRGLLSAAPDRALNDRRLNDARAEAGRLIGFQGDPRSGLRYLAPAAVTRWHPQWLVWAAALLLMEVPGGRRLVTAVRGRRGRNRAPRGTKRA